MAEEPVETGTSPLEIAEESVLTTLLRPELEELRAYVPHVPPGIEVKLDANEPPPSLSIEIRDRNIEPHGPIVLAVVVAHDARIMLILDRCESRLTIRCNSSYSAHCDLQSLQFAR